MSMAFLVDSQDAGPDAAGQVVHPLAPLNAAEIEAASAAVKKSKDLKDSARFVYISLYEPSKHDVIAFDGGTGLLPDRLVKVVIRERAERATYEAVVRLPEGELRSYQRVAGVQPSVMFEEFMAAEDIVRKDPRWQEAMRKRGVEDFSLCMIDPWSTPNVEPCLLYTSDAADDLLCVDLGG